MDFEELRQIPPNLRTLNQRMFLWALNERGIKEIPGKVANPRIQYYHEFTGLKATSDETAWCSAFMNCAAVINGGKGTNSAMARSWLLWGNKVEASETRQGDIVIYKRLNADGIDDGASGHVGFLTKPVGLGIWLPTLGGNENNQVMIKDYARINVLGYRRA